MKTKFLLIIALFVAYGCSDIYETISSDEISDESVPLTRSANETYEYYYWSNGVKIPLIKDENKSYVIVKSESYKSIENSILSNTIHTHSINDYAPLAIKSSRSSDKSLGLKAFTIDNNSSIRLAQDDIVYCAPYFKTSNGSEIGITNIISVQISGSQGCTKLQEIAEECCILTCMVPQTLLQTQNPNYLFIM